MWEWYKGDITIELILSIIADKIAGYGVSYSANELLKDLELVSNKGNINKKGKLVMAHQLHDKYHHNRNSMVIINPT